MRKGRVVAVSAEMPSLLARCWHSREVGTSARLSSETFSRRTIGCKGEDDDDEVTNLFPLFLNIGIASSKSFKT